MSPFDAKVDAIVTFKRDAEAILQMVAQIRESTESIQNSPKKDRKRRTAAGE